MTHSTDHLERETLLKAPRPDVWRALSQADEFGRWFGAAFEGQVFAPGAQLRGRITTPGHEQLVLEVWIEQMEPQHLLSFRWHPGAVEPGIDYSDEPTTRVSFELSDVVDGTWLRIRESGFDALPPLRRLNAFRLHSQGWDEQLLNIAAHVEAAVPGR